MLAPSKNVGGCTLLWMSCKSVLLSLSNVCVGWLEEEEEVEREEDLAFFLIYLWPCACFFIAIMTVWEMASRTTLGSGFGSQIHRLWVCWRRTLPNETISLKESQHGKKSKCTMLHNAIQRTIRFDTKFVMYLANSS